MRYSSNVEAVLSGVLAAVYLRGLPGRAAPPRSWPGVSSALRRAAGAGPLPADPHVLSTLLREAGYWQEAAVLLDRARWPLAVDLVAKQRVITAEDSTYPSGWRASGVAAPPALWRKPGAVPLPSGAPWVTLVGSRQITRAVRDFARAAGEAVAAGGGVVCSGGAVGVDRAAVLGARASEGATVELLPCGFDHAPASSAERWSLVPPGEPFSTANAMERNLLLYAASSRSLVVHARYRAGGSWHGAVSALRHRLGPIFVREPAPGEALSDPDYLRAHAALVGLGAVSLRHPELLLNAPARDPAQPALALGA